MNVVVNDIHSIPIMSSQDKKTELPAVINDSLRMTADVTDCVKHLNEPETKKKVLSIIKERFGSEDENVLLTLIRTSSIEASCVPVSNLLPASMSKRFEKRGMVPCYCQVSSLLKEFYKLKPGVSEDLHPVCRVEWAPSILPLFFDFTVTFWDDEEKCSYLVHMCHIDQSKMTELVKTVVYFVTNVRAINSYKFTSDVEDLEKKGKARHPNVDRKLFYEKVVTARQLKKVEQHTKAEFSSLIARKEDPINEAEKWFPKLTQLAVEANCRAADLSLFENLQRFSHQRQARYIEEYDSEPETPTSTAMKKKRPRKKTPKKVVVGNEQSTLLGDRETTTPAGIDDNGFHPGSNQTKQSAIATQPGIIQEEISEHHLSNKHTLQVSHDVSQRTGTGLSPSMLAFLPTGTRIPSPSDEATNELSGTVALNPTAREFRVLGQKPTIFAAQDNKVPPGEESTVSAGAQRLIADGNVDKMFCKETLQQPDSCERMVNKALPFHGNNEEDSRYVVVGEDLSDDEDCASSTQSFLPKDRKGRELPAYQQWAFDLSWFYYDRVIDTRLLAEGGFPFQVPWPWLPETDFNAEKLPIMVLNARVPGKQPMFEYDPKWNRYIITPHTDPISDIRDLCFHPDWLARHKLVEYQAVERANHVVWRHDRNSWSCNFPACGKKCADHELSTQLCLGCGPASTVRYCSKAHQNKDLARHWEVCEDSVVLFKGYIDSGTQPVRFSRRFPLIRDIKARRSPEKLCQRQYAVWKRGRYTIFAHHSSPFTVQWPSAEMETMYAPRVERLLNAALLDQDLDHLVEYLFCLLRMALRLCGRYSPNMKEALRSQFAGEFGWNIDTTCNEDPCECRWLGSEADEHNCAPHCKDLRDRFGLVGPFSGIKQILEQLESEFWVLRVWQRQHPTIRGWRHRLAGYDFPGTKLQDLSKVRPLLGRGWMGYGAPDTFGGWEPIR